MKVSELGEFGLIEILNQIVGESGKADPDLSIGIGDDAAAWQCGESLQVSTTDMLVEGIHFSPDTISWHDLGWKALAVNISDIAAMGGIPVYAMISLGMPPETEVERIADLYQGMAKISREFGLSIVGGDTTEAPLLIISPTVTGWTEKDRLMTRSSAKPGDLIAVTGNLGASAAGLKMLQQGLLFDADTDAFLKEALLRPYPRVNEGKILSQHNVKTAIDISDGLVADLTHICQSSQVSASLFSENIPTHPAVKDHFPAEALSLALSGGEDYELLFTAPEQIIEEARQQLSTPLTLIGKITVGKPGNVTILDRDGNLIVLPKRGWEHFGHTR